MRERLIEVVEKELEEAVDYFINNEFRKIKIGFYNEPC
jgi:hypothetical protein